MEELKTLEHCKTCKSELNGKFCSNCGHSNELKRIDKQYILNEIGSVLSFDKGIFYTIRELLIRPGQTIKEFISEDRNRLVKPIIFIILSSLIYTIVKQIFQFEDGYINYSNENETSVTFIFEWIQSNYGYANIIMGVFVAFWIKILFRKHDYNFYEILIVLCFAMGISMLIYSVFGIFEGLTNLGVLQMAGIVGFLYTSWVIGQFFNKSKKTSYLKAFVAYFLGMLMFVFVAIGLGYGIDFIW